jgi:hypothetical protein
MDHGMLMDSIEMYGTQVIPMVHDMLASSVPASTASVA